MKAVISGYGKMGHMVEEVLASKGLECAGASEDIASFDPVLARECVCIDFTTPEAFKANYRSIAGKFKAAVVGTTGWNDIKDEVCAEFRRCGCTLVYASNFSVGVNALFAAVQKASEILAGAGYSSSICETHHIHKLDAPSGTAKSLATIVESATGCKPPIESIREGEVPGIHTVEFLSEADKLTFTHEAFSRRGFAEGAVMAAQLTDNISGIHEFKDIIL